MFKAASERKTHKYRSLKNDLERLVPDRDIEFTEDDLLADQPEKSGSSLREMIERALRNFLAILLCVAITGL